MLALLVSIANESKRYSMGLHNVIDCTMMRVRNKVNCTVHRASYVYVSLYFFNTFRKTFQNMVNKADKVSS